MFEDPEGLYITDELPPLSEKERVKDAFAVFAFNIKRLSLTELDESDLEQKLEMLSTLEQYTQIFLTSVYQKRVGSIVIDIYIKNGSSSLDYVNHFNQLSQEYYKAGKPRYSKFMNTVSQVWLRFT